ncbi:laccase 1 [Mycena galericulata]|nr:laccase 1 [Mycena galericulata]
MHLSILSALGALSVVYSSAIGPVGEIFLSNKVLLCGLAGALKNSDALPGQTFRLNVVDGLTDTSMPRASSIHWHGIFQDNTNYADGYESLLCPIVPGNSFLYQFSTPTQAGTFLYHSHFALQFCEGLRGSLSMIQDPNDPFAHLYEDTVITLQDWNHFTTNNLLAIPNFSSILINGLGRFLGGPLSPLAVVSVKHGLRYRFRLVSLSCDPNFIFKIDGHNMTLIEADGINHDPVTVDSLQLFAGQRYSFVLNAFEKVIYYHVVRYTFMKHCVKVDNYWIRATPDYVNTGFANNTNSAILRWFICVNIGAPNTNPTTANRNSTNLLAETDLHPLVPSPVPGVHHVGGADVSINLEIGSFIHPTSPALLQILSHAQPAQDLLPTGSYYALPPNKVIEISIPHPFHLHGHAFHVVRSAGFSTYNWNNPVIRDTVSTGSAAAGDNRSRSSPRGRYPDHSARESSL